MMKRIYLLLLAFVMCFVLHGNAQKQTDVVKYAISIKIDPPSQPSKVYLMISGAVDSSAKFVNGKYEFKGELKHAERASVIFDFNNLKETVKVPIFLNGGQVDISLDNALNVVVSGDKWSAEYYNKIAKPVGIFGKKIWKLQLENGNAYKKKSQDTATITKRLLKTIDSCFNVPRMFIRENPNSILSIGAIYWLGKGKINGEIITLNDLEQIFLSIDPVIRNSPYGKKYAAELAAWKENEKKKE